MCLRNHEEVQGGKGGKETAGLFSTLEVQSAGVVRKRNILMAEEVVP